MFNFPLQHATFKGSGKKDKKDQEFGIWRTPFQCSIGCFSCSKEFTCIYFFFYFFNSFQRNFLKKFNPQYPGIDEL